MGRDLSETVPWTTSCVTHMDRCARKSTSVGPTQAGEDATACISGVGLGACAHLFPQDRCGAGEAGVKPVA